VTRRARLRVDAFGRTSVAALTLAAHAPCRRGVRALPAPALVVLALVVAAVPSAAATSAGASRPAPEATVTGAAACDCGRFAEELAAARAVFASRGEGATSRPSQAAQTRFRERILEAFARASCLVACNGVADPERDEARVLLATTAFKSRRFGPTEAAAGERLTRGLAETERCLEHPAPLPACRLWHGSIRGIQARGSWNPMQLALPKQLLVEFRAARGDAPPGEDPPDGAATRAEAALLVRAPSVAGGDVHAARQLMDAAAAAPSFACTVENRILLAETLARTGDGARAVAELRAALAAGLPTCGDNRYENASDLEDAARCLARLEERPDQDPGWDDDCR